MRRVLIGAVVLVVVVVGALAGIRRFTEPPPAVLDMRDVPAANAERGAMPYVYPNEELRELCDVSMLRRLVVGSPEVVEIRLLRGTLPIPCASLAPNGASG